MLQIIKSYIKILPACPKCEKAGLDGLYCSDCMEIIDPSKSPFFSVEINEDKLYMRFKALNQEEVDRAVKAIKSLIAKEEEPASVTTNSVISDDIFDKDLGIKPHAYISIPDPSIKVTFPIKFKADKHDPFNPPFAKKIYDISKIKERVSALLSENKNIYAIAKILNDEGILRPQRDVCFTYNNVKAFINKHLGSLRDIRAASARTYFEKLRREQRDELEGVLHDCVIVKKWDDDTIIKYFEEAKYLNSGEGYKISYVDIADFRKGLSV